jgi:hypothetical protein
VDLKETKGRGREAPPFLCAEDKLIAILQEARERAQALTTHKIVPIHRPYPHPKEPNLRRDHRNRQASVGRLLCDTRQAPFGLRAGLKWKLRLHMLSWKTTIEEPK